MRFVGGGIGHRIWHLLPQPEPLPHQRRRLDPKGKGRATDEGLDEDVDEGEGPEPDGEYDLALEDLQRYIRDLEDDPEATIRTIEDGEGPEVDEEREEWGYGDPDTVQVVGLAEEENGGEEDNEDNGEEEHIGPEGTIHQADDELFDLGGFGEL